MWTLKKPPASHQLAGGFSPMAENSNLRLGLFLGRVLSTVMKDRRDYDMVFSDKPVYHKIRS